MNQIREKTSEIGGYFQQLLPTVLTSTYNQKTRPGRQRLQRNVKAWAGSDVYASVHVDTETSSHNQKTRLGRQRLQRKEKNWPGAEVIGDNVQCSILTNREKKFKDIPGNIPSPGSGSKDKAKGNVDEKKETPVDSMTSNDSISEGSEVIKSKDKTRPGRQRLRRDGKAWPGDELIDDDAYDSVHKHVDSEVKLDDTSSHSQKTRPGRQRLQRKEKLLPASKGADMKESLDVKIPVVSSQDSNVISDGVRRSVLMVQDDMPEVRTKQKEIVDDNKDDIPNPGSKIQDKAKTVDDKMETIHPTTSNVSSEGYKVNGDGVHGSILTDDIRIPKSRNEDKEKESVENKKDNIGKDLSTEKSKMDITFVLPAQCISYIISLTTPRDASRLSLACPAFKSAADSDTVWEKFLPSDYGEIISNSSSISASSSIITSLSRKDLYFYLCHNPILINNHTMSFSLVQESGRKCYMVGARGLSIAWGDSPSYWNWISLPESRFPEVAKLKEVWWFEITARIETKILSCKTNYAAYLVFKFVNSRQGFNTKPIEFDVYFEGRNNHKRRSALLDPPTNMPPQLSQDRGDGWMEIEMGEFFNENRDDGTVVCRLCESGSVYKHGIIIQGIEVRPTYGR